MHAVAVNFQIGSLLHKKWSVPACPIVTSVEFRAFISEKGGEYVQKHRDRRKHYRRHYRFPVRHIASFFHRARGVPSARKAKNLKTCAPGLRARGARCERRGVRHGGATGGSAPLAHWPVGQQHGVLLCRGSLAQSGLQRPFGPAALACAAAPDPIAWCVRVCMCCMDHAPRPRSVAGFARCC